MPLPALYLLCLHRADPAPKTPYMFGQTNDLSRRLREHNDPEFRETLRTQRRLGRAGWCMKDL